MAKKQRRLKNVCVREISLVDKGAVPDSDFVVLSKRAETMPESLPVESELVQLEKAMREDQQWEAEYLLHVLADFCALVRTMKSCLAKLPPDVATAFDALKAAMVEGEEEEDAGEEVEKNDSEAVVDESNYAQLAARIDELSVAIEKLSPKEPVVAPKSEVDELAAVMAKRDSEKKQRSAADAMDRLEKLLTETATTISDNQTKIRERFDAFDARFNHATGKE